MSLISQWWHLRQTTEEPDINSCKNIRCRLVFEHHFSLFSRLFFVSRDSVLGRGQRETRFELDSPGGGARVVFAFQWPVLLALNHATTATWNGGLSYCFGTCNFWMVNVVKTFPALFSTDLCNICGKCRSLISTIIR